MRSKLITATITATIIATGLASAAEPPVRKCSPTGGPHVLWSRPLGHSLIPGPVTVAGGKILAGANNDRPLDPTLQGDHGILACVEAATGRFLWQAAHRRLPSRLNDIPTSTIGSRPCVDGERVYYVSNRGELVCLDLEGFRDGENDGDCAELRTGELCADIVWALDMIETLGIFKRDADDVGNPTSSPIVIGDLVYCVTGNGVGSNVWCGPPRPHAPSFLAADKATGRVVWTSSAPGDRIIYAQWSSPAHTRVDSMNQVIFPGGDGKLYTFEAKAGELLESIDLNGISPAQVEFRDWVRPFPVAAPVVHEGGMYLGLGRDLETKSLSPLIAVKVGRAGSAPEGVLWTFQHPELGSIIGSPVIAGDTLFAKGQEGSLFALNLATGCELWHTALEDGRGAVASPAIHDGKLYVPGESRVTVFRAGPAPERLGAYEFDEAYPSTPVIALGRLHVATQQHLWALRPWE